MSNLIEVTDANFNDEVLDGDRFVLLFHAEWNGPSKMMKSQFESLIGEFEGKLKLGILDVDKDNFTPARYNVRMIPVLILFQHGEAVETITGANKSSFQIRSLIEQEFMF